MSSTGHNNSAVSPFRSLPHIIHSVRLSHWIYECGRLFLFLLLVTDGWAPLCVPIVRLCFANDWTKGYFYSDSHIQFSCWISGKSAQYNYFGRGRGLVAVATRQRFWSMLYSIYGTQLGDGNREFYPCDYRFVCRDLLIHMELYSHQVIWNVGVGGIIELTFELIKLYKYFTKNYYLIRIR